MFTRVLACGLLLTLATPARAQQQTSTASTEADPARKNQVQLFENLLAASVVSGGQTAADQARKVVPGVLLTLSDVPKVRGWWSPLIGYQYYVELPDLLPTQVLTWNQQRMLSQSGQGGQATPVNRGGSGGQGANAQNAVTTSDTVVGAFDLSVAYTDAVYAALYNVILDNSFGLPIKDDELLQVVSAPAPNGTNFLFPDRRKLILQIRGADLRALHEHRITRDEAKQKIVETRF